MLRIELSFTSTKEVYPAFTFEVVKLLITTCQGRLKSCVLKAFTKIYAFWVFEITKFWICTALLSCCWKLSRFPLKANSIDLNWIFTIEIMRLIFCSSFEKYNRLLLDEKVLFSYMKFSILNELGVEVTTFTLVSPKNATLLCEISIVSILKLLLSCKRREFMLKIEFELSPNSKEVIPLKFKL